MNSPSDYNYRELGSPNGTMDGINKNGHLVSINGEVEGMEIMGVTPFSDFHVMYSFMW